jgi:hypothetical protein
LTPEHPAPGWADAIPILGAARAGAQGGTPLPSGAFIAGATGTQDDFYKVRLCNLAGAAQDPGRGWAAQRHCCGNAPGHSRLAGATPSRTGATTDGAEITPLSAPHRASCTLASRDGRG